MAVDDPAHVAGPVGPEKVRDNRLGPNTEKALDSSHRSDQAFLPCDRHATKHRAYVVARARVERGEGLPTSLGKPQEPASAVGFGESLVDQTVLLEAAQETAQVARIQSKLLAEFTRR